MFCVLYLTPINLITQKNTNMTIKVRERKPKNGMAKLFLDVYDPSATKKRTSISLGLGIVALTLFKAKN